MNDNNASPRLRLTYASSIPAEPTEWLWLNRIQMGTLNILAGRAGVGKSLLGVWLAGKGSHGQLHGELDDEPFCTMFLDYENPKGQAMIPRLRAVKADLTKIVFLHKEGLDGELYPMAIPEDLGLIAEAQEVTGARLLIIDPLNAALEAANFDPHKDTSVRRVLAPLMQIAEEYRLAVLGVMHMRKGADKDALMQLMGSVAYGAAARSVLMMGLDPEDPEGILGNRRVLAHRKNSNGPITDSMEWELRNHQFRVKVDGSRRIIRTRRLDYAGESGVEADELMQPPTPGTKLEDAINWLSAELGNGGLPAADVIAQAKAAGITEGTVKRAGKKLKVDKIKQGFDEGWVWKLPKTPKG